MAVVQAMSRQVERKKKVQSIVSQAFHPTEEMESKGPFLLTVLFWTTLNYFLLGKLRTWKLKNFQFTVECMVAI